MERIERIKRTLYQPLVLIVVGVLGLGTTTAVAGITAYVVDAQDGLHALNLATAETNFIATIDREFVFDLALSDSGRMFAQRDAVPGFFEIDPLTGQGSGDIGLDNFVRSIGFMGDRVIGQDGNSLRFVEVNTATGQLNPISPISTSFLADEIAVVSSELLFATDRVFAPGSGFSESLYSIDLTGGGATEIGALDIVDNTRGIQYVNGTLYAVSNTGSLYSIDTATAASTLIGNVGFSVDAFAAVPAPGGVACIGLAGLVAVRRRR